MELMLQLSLEPSVLDLELPPAPHALHDAAQLIVVERLEDVVAPSSM